MRHNQLIALVPELCSIARRAGQAIMLVYESDRILSHLKEDASPVSEADLLAHECIVEGLARLVPELPVVSEEDSVSHATRRHDSIFWLIDPIDGTKEFLSRTGQFTVNIALIQRGRPVLGVVYAPAMGEMYWGGFGLGAFRESAFFNGPIRVKERSQDLMSLQVVASKTHMNADTRNYIARLGQTELVEAGSSLKFCLVATGEADIYPRLAPTCEWDTAAAQAVLEGAGGVVLDLNGMPLQYGKANVLNPSFVAASSRELAFNQ
jgi:3'(2'), 5'-bisphosphate nucleotidase